MITKIITFIDKHKYTIIAFFILLLSLFINIVSIKSCSKYYNLNNNNIEALSDTIRYYKDKNGNLISEKKILQGDLNTLKLSNDSLYDVIKKMGVKDPSSVIHVDGVVENPSKDTVWYVDTIYNINITKDFKFTNEFRLLEGNVFFNDSICGLNILKDKTYVDYTLVIEDNIVKINTKNPYVTFTNIEGITLPTQKHKTWGFSVGPAIFAGYNPTSKKIDYGIGFSVVYGYRFK